VALSALLELELGLFGFEVLELQEYHFGFLGASPLSVVAFETVECREEVSDMVLDDVYRLDILSMVEFGFKGWKKY
jgi:hypothetical protein